MQAACLHNPCNRQDVRAASRNSLTSTTTQPYPAASGERRPKVFRQSRSLDLLSLIAERVHHLSHNQQLRGCASRLHFTINAITQDISTTSRNSRTSKTTQTCPAASGERRPKVFRQSRSLDLLSLIAERVHHLSHNQQLRGCASRPHFTINAITQDINTTSRNSRTSKTTQTYPAASGERRPKVFRQSRSLDLLSLIAERVHHLSHNQQLRGCASRLPSQSMQPPRRTRSIQELTNVHNHTTLPGCIR